ncbi:uncharacterized protein LOC143022120 isoform X2 [Oratosquilla oratoria]|uniref:uncharacterized protein LOC143022120 isoform X2 n=1 Tax=Oratosquilla oratoria TaxID=337810 RepID=UPI003F76D674
MGHPERSGLSTTPLTLLFPILLTLPALPSVWGYYDNDYGGGGGGYGRDERAGGGGGGGGGGGEGGRGGWWSRGPSFGTFPDTVSVTEGETAHLPCVVNNLRDHSVTWMRRRDLHILTVGHVTYSADDRFKVLHTEGSQEWTLVIQFAQIRDSGAYECQLNSDSKISRAVTLQVTAGSLRVEIVGARELFIEESSSLTLTCVVTSHNMSPPSKIFWYHENKIIDYNSPRGGVNLQVDKIEGKSTARLLVSSVGEDDSGMYSCVPPGSHPATVRVHVQKGEHEAAIQQGGISRGSSLYRTSPFFTPSLSSLSSSLLTFFLLPLYARFLLVSFPFPSSSSFSASYFFLIFHRYIYHLILLCLLSWVLPLLTKLWRDVGEHQPLLVGRLEQEETQQPT